MAFLILMLVAGPLVRLSEGRAGAEQAGMAPHCLRLGAAERWQGSGRTGPLMRARKGGGCLSECGHLAVLPRVWRGSSRECGRSGRSNLSYLVGTGHLVLDQLTLDQHLQGQWLWHGHAQPASKGPGGGGGGGGGGGCWLALQDVSRSDNVTRDTSIKA